MNPRISSAILVSLGVAFLSGCAGFMGAERRQTNTEVILVSFGSTMGELAPCG